MEATETSKNTSSMGLCPELKGVQQDNGITSICPHIISSLGKSGSGLDNCSSKEKESMATYWDEANVDAKTDQDAAYQHHHNIRHVQESWKIVASQLHVQATQLFYQRLFTMDPSLEQLFSSIPMDVQAEKLFKTLDMTVKYVEHIQALGPFLKTLGANHAVVYSVKREHYAVVGEALLWTLETGLGVEVFTNRVKEAWAWAYGFIADTMAEAGEAALRKELSTDIALPVSTTNATRNMTATKTTESEPRGEESVEIIAGYKGHHNHQQPKKRPTKSCSNSNQPTSLLLSEEQQSRYTELVQASWKEMNLGVEATESFYSALFETHPDIRLLFSHLDTTASQSEKLYKTLGLIVKYLNRKSPVLDPFLHHLGKQHAKDYGVCPTHYEAVKEQFLGVLVHANLKEPSHELLEAWAWAYDVVSRIMANAAVE